MRTKKRGTNRTGLSLPVRVMLCKLGVCAWGCNKKGGHKAPKPPPHKESRYIRSPRSSAFLLSGSASNSSSDIVVMLGPAGVPGTPL